MSLMWFMGLFLKGTYQCAQTTYQVFLCIFKTVYGSNPFLRVIIATKRRMVLGSGLGTPWGPHDQFLDAIWAVLVKTVIGPSKRHEDVGYGLRVL